MSQKDSSPLLSSEDEMKSSGIEQEEEMKKDGSQGVQGKQISRKKYNVITEKTRKEIITQLTEKSRNIKEVAQQYNLKLSTCKAILSVYLKEGRIGKKTTRDRKSKIVNTVIIATINPIYPLSSQIIPYVNISEVKNPAKEENNQDLVNEALNKANEHLRISLMSNAQNQQQPSFIIQQNDESQQITEQQMSQIKQTFMECQFQLLSQLLLNSRKPSIDTQNGAAAVQNGTGVGGQQTQSQAISPNLSAISGNANTGSPVQNPLKNLFGTHNSFNLASLNQTPAINPQSYLNSINNEILNDFSIDDNVQIKRKYSENNKIYRKNSVIIPPKESLSETGNPTEL